MERYQQVFHASAFDKPFTFGEYDLDPVMTIQEIMLSRKGGDVPLLSGFNAPEIQVRLSTTMKETADALSPDFQDNLGPDQKLVYEGPLTTSPGSHNEIIIELQEPFMHDSFNGNLLMDVKVKGGDELSNALFAVGTTHGSHLRSSEPTLSPTTSIPSPIASPGKPGKGGKSSGKSKRNRNLVESKADAGKGPKGLIPWNRLLKW